MKIAIAGAGITGAYIYRLLKNAGYDDITIFDQHHNTTCGTSPCAWGTSGGWFEFLLERAGLEPAKYVYRQFDYAFFDEMKIKINLMTINKPRLIKDLLDGAEIKYESLLNYYNRIIDATGTARAYLPPIHDDVICPCVQYRVYGDGPKCMGISMGRAGYAWSFPLSNNQYHIGAGSIVIQNPSKILDDFGLIKTDRPVKREVVCSCTGKIRLTGPQFSRPFVQGNVWGVGEAIGCVSPLAADGIVPGMRSAWILFNHFETFTPSGYESAILNEFKWMEPERRIIDKFRQGKKVGLRDAWVLKENSKRMGMQVGFWQALELLKRWSR